MVMPIKLMVVVVVESTKLSSNIRPILFEYHDFEYIRYNMELRYILMLAKTRKTTFES